MRFFNLMFSQCADQTCYFFIAESIFNQRGELFILVTPLIMRTDIINYLVRSAMGYREYLVQSTHVVTSKPMIGENRQLVTHEPVEFEK